MSDDGWRDTAIAALCMSDGIDRCCFCFLLWHNFKIDNKYHGVFGQVTDVFNLDHQNETGRKNVCRSLRYCNEA